MAGQRKYSDKQVALGLTSLAIIGSPTLASRELAKHGIELSKERLWDWANRTYPERYQEIRREKLSEIREYAAQRSEEIIALAADKEIDFIQALHPEEMEPRDRANALRNLSTTRGISVDVSKKLRDEPDTIIEHRHSGEEMLDELVRRRPHLVVDGTAEEIEDAEVVEDDQKQLTG